MLSPIVEHGVSGIVLRSQCTFKGCIYKKHILDIYTEAFLEEFLDTATDQKYHF